MFFSIFRYLASFDTPSDVEEYLQGLLDLKNSKHSKFIRDFIRRKWPVTADVALAPDNVQVSQVGWNNALWEI